MFLLVPAYPGCPGQTAVKWLLLRFEVVTLFVHLVPVFEYQLKPGAAIIGGTGGTRPPNILVGGTQT